MSSTLRQDTREAVLDITAANYGTSADIPANRVVLLDTTNIMSTSSPRGVVLPTASGGVAGTFGVTVEVLYKRASSTASPRPGRVALSGSGIQCVAEGAITAGDYVQASDTAGKEGYVKVAGAGIQQLGQAETTAADGEPVFIRIDKARNA
jgi:hypothetical protein